MGERYAMPHDNGEEMVAYASDPANISYQADVAMKACLQTSELFSVLLERLSPVMKDLNIPASDDETMKADFDPSSKVARDFKKITEQQRLIQNRIENALVMLEI